MITWLQARSKMWTVDLPFRQNVQVNIDTIMKRIETMGCKIEHDQVCNKATNTLTSRLLSFRPRATQATQLPPYNLSWVPSLTSLAVLQIP
jgi:hypothetical protein